MQWIFLAYKKVCARHRWKIYISTIIVFLLLPLVSLIPVSIWSAMKKMKKNEFKSELNTLMVFSHMIEASFNAVLNLVVISTLIFSYHSLRSQMREILSPQTYKRVEKKLTRQMFLYSFFFILRFIFLLTSSIWYMGLTDVVYYCPDENGYSCPYSENKSKINLLVGPGVFFFLQAVSGDAPLVCVCVEYMCVCVYMGCMCVCVWGVCMCVCMSLHYTCK